MIRSDLIYYLLINILENKEGSLPDDTLQADLKCAEVYVSHIDQIGFLNFYPLWKKEISYNRICNELMRIMWNCTLCNDAVQNDYLKTLDDNSHLLADQLKVYYTFHNIDELYKAWKKTKLYLTNMITYAQDGIILAELLKRAGRHPFSNIGELNKLSRDIESIDYKIISCGEVYDVLTTVTTLFCYEKEMLAGSDIVNMAEKTTKIYNNLLTRVQTFNLLCEKLFIILCNRYKGGYYEHIN